MALLIHCVSFRQTQFPFTAICLHVPELCERLRVSSCKEAEYSKTKQKFCWKIISGESLFWGPLEFFHIILFFFSLSLMFHVLIGRITLSKKLRRKMIIILKIQWA